MEVFKFFGTIGLRTDEAEKSLDGIVGKAEKTSSSLGDKFSAIGSSIHKFIVLPALAAATAIGTIALKKGWDRLIGIDTARAKLQALGHDAEQVDAIMDNALASVKGTAFGLESAATAAASAVAAGVEPGKELERYLSLVGDAAAIAGTNFEDMGSIFNKVMTSGVVQAQELNQLSDKGIPIFQMLADEMGVTADEVKKLASDGKISSEIFLNAIEEGFGGAAKTMGELSVTAAWDNMWASVGRLGAAFLGAGDDAEGFFDQLKPVLGELTDWFDSLAPIAQVLGVHFGNLFSSLVVGVKGFASIVSSLFTTISSLATKAVEGIGKARVVFDRLATTLRTRISGQIKKVKERFQELLDIILEIDFGLLVENIINFSKQAIEVLSDVLDFFLEFFEPINTYWNKQIDTFIDLFKGIVRAFNQAMSGDWSGAFSSLKTATFTAFTSVADNIVEVFTDLWDNIKELMISIDWGEAASTMMTMLGNAIRGYISLLGDIGAAIKDWISEKLNLDEGSSWSDIGVKILENIKSGIETAKSTVGGIAEAIRGWIAEKLDIGDNAGWLEIATTILGHIVEAVSGAGEQFGEFVGELITGINGAMTAEEFKGLVDNLLNFIATGIVGAVIAMTKVAKALVSGIAKGLLGIDSWDTVADTIVNEIENHLEGKTIKRGPKIEFNWNIKEGWEDTIWSKGMDLLRDLNWDFFEGAEESLNPTIGMNRGQGVSSGGGGVAIPTPTIDTSAVDTLIAEVTAKINAAVAKIEEMGRNYTAKLIDGMTKGITTNQSKVTLNIGILGNQMKSEFDKVHNKVNQAIQQAMNKVQTEYRSGLLKAYATVRDNLTRISEAFRSQIAAVTRAGEETGRGFYNGLNSQRGRIISLASDIASSVSNTMRRALDINSPSGVTEEIGEWTIAGLVNSLLKGAEDVRTATARVTEAMDLKPAVAELEVTQQDTPGPTLQERMTDEIVALLKAILDKDGSIYIDGQRFGEVGSKHINRHNQIQETRMRRIQGGAL